MTIALLLTAAASAHIQLGSPEPRYIDFIKDGPCGMVGDQRSTKITQFAPGETITVSWKETVNHPSHYRISFDDDGTDGFVDPATIDEYYSNDTVLLDDIGDEADLVYSVEVTLPDVECDNCTLQLIQVMHDKPPYVPGTNDLYYQCADLELVAGGGTTQPSPTDTSDTGETVPPPTGTTEEPPATTDDSTDSGGASAAAGCGGCAGTPSGADGLLAVGLVALASARRAGRRS